MRADDKDVEATGVLFCSMPPHIRTIPALCWEHLLGGWAEAGYSEMRPSATGRLGAI